MHILSMKAEYALLAMVYLATRQESLSAKKRSVITIEVISKATGVPMNFLSKIMIQLNRSDLIRSFRGFNGGCALSRTPERITAYDIIEAVEGSVKLNRCSLSPDSCSSASWCPFYAMWMEAQENLESVLKKYTLHSLAVCIKDLPEEQRFFNSLNRRSTETQYKILVG